MRAIRIEKVHAARLVELPDPDPPPGWARIKISSAGICATDLAILRGTLPADFPLTPGHEWSGVVDRVGAPADESWLDQRVVGDNEITCLRCRYCRSGDWRRCPKFRHVGFHAPGAWADYLVLPVHNLHRLPDTVSLEQGALAEPLGVGLAVARMSGARIGSTAVVLGAGPIGLNCLAALKASGAARIICLDRRPRRLEIAHAWGASVETATASNLKETARWHHPNGSDIVVEATGDPELLPLAVALVRFGGALVLAGHCGGKQVSLAPDEIQERNLHVLGAGSHAGFVEPAALAAADEIVRTDSMISHRFRLEDYERALAPETSADELYIKGVFTF